MKRLPAGVLGGGAVFAVGVAIFALLPLFLEDSQLPRLVTVGTYLIAMIGLNILTGYSGQISLGHGAFVALGAYTSAILVTQTDLGTEATIPIAGAVAGVAGFLFGFPALRLTGVYLALATFGLAVAMVQIPQSIHLAEWTGGPNGLQFALPKTPYYLTWSIAGGLFVAAWVLLRGRLGRRFRAVRDAPIAAVASGVNLALAKTLAFGIAAAYAGVAGALVALSSGFVSPFAFTITLSITLLVGTALGGFGSLSGLVFGALFIVYAPVEAEDLVESTQAPAVMYALILLVVLFLMPGGAAMLMKRLVILLKRAVVPLYTRSTPEKP